MQGRAAVWSLVVVLMGAPVFAQSAPSNDAPDATELSTPGALFGKTQAVGDFDIRGTFQTDILLGFIGLGIGGDYGVIPLGKGTLALGAEIEFGICGSACWFFGAFTDTSLSSTFYSPHARVSYHFSPSRQRGLEKVDFYALGFLGATYSTTSLSGGGIEYRGNDLGPSFGVGAGGKFFGGDRWFVGGEVRLRYSAGTYSYSLRTGDVVTSDTYETWSLSGLHVDFFAGIRL